MMTTYTQQDLNHAEQKVTEWTAKGDARKPGSASREEAWGQARKWEATAENIRAALK